MPIRFSLVGADLFVRDNIKWLIIDPARGLVK